MSDRCPNCGWVLDDPSPVPPEPPIGTTVRDKYGVTITRRANGFWGQSGMVPGARWEPMWRSVGPLIVV